MFLIRFSHLKIHFFHDLHNGSFNNYIVFLVLDVPELLKPFPSVHVFNYFSIKVNTEVSFYVWVPFYSSMLHFLKLCFIDYALIGVLI